MKMKYPEESWRWLYVHFFFGHIDYRAKVFSRQLETLIILHHKVVLFLSSMESLEGSLTGAKKNFWIFNEMPCNGYPATELYVFETSTWNCVIYSH